MINKKGQPGARHNDKQDNRKKKLENQVFMVSRQVTIKLSAYLNLSFKVNMQSYMSDFRKYYDPHRKRTILMSSNTTFNKYQDQLIFDKKFSSKY